MANNVFANMMEISCKKAAGKSICSFPDVCWTPPQTNVTPNGVPIPYPNTGMATDTTKGSRDVKITKKEVMLKNSSYFKKSMGDEPGSAPMKGLVTKKNRGKVYFQMWSMDVKIEGKNAVRMLDIMTHNHGSVPGNTPTWPYIDEMSAPDVAPSEDNPCKKEIEREQEDCKDFKPHNPQGEDACDAAKLSSNRKRAAPSKSRSAQRQARGIRKPSASKNDSFKKGAACIRARRCQLVPYKSSAAGMPQCCDKQTGHHLIEASAIMGDRKSGTGGGLVAGAQTSDGKPYSENMAPSMCVSGSNHGVGTHGEMHTVQSFLNLKSQSDDVGEVPMQSGDPVASKTMTYGDAKANANEAIKTVFPSADCEEKCINAQLDKYHAQHLQMDDDTKIFPVATTTSKTQADIDKIKRKNANFATTSSAHS